MPMQQRNYAAPLRRRLGGFVVRQDPPVEDDSEETEDGVEEEDAEEDGAEEAEAESESESEEEGAEGEESESEAGGYSSSEDGMDSDDEEEETQEPPPLQGKDEVSGDQQPSTVVIDAPFQTGANVPPPPPSFVLEGPPPRKISGLSEGTEHLLIAAGSIGATVVLVLVIYAIYSMRKRGMTIGDLVRYRTWKDRRWQEPSIEAQNWKKQAAQYGFQDRLSKSLPVVPPETVLRRPASTFNSPQVTRKPIAEARLSRLSRRDSNKSPFRDEMRDNLYPLPTQLPPARTTDSRHTRDLSDQSDTFPIQTQDSSPTEARSPQTFKQFLANRGIGAATPKASRFSWTTAAQTPKDPNFNRVSISTSRSSVPRFRTIESWVDQQTSRVETQKLRQESPPGETSSVKPKVPDVPDEHQDTTQSQDTVKPEKARRQTAISEATVFRHHPGDEVVIARGSLVPSEVLNLKTLPPSL